VQTYNQIASVDGATIYLLFILRTCAGSLRTARFFVYLCRKWIEMDLLQIHKRIRLALNKDMTGYLLPEEIDRALDRAQLQEFRHLYGDDRKLPDSPLAYGMTLKIHADLLPFKRSVEYNDGLYNPQSNPYGTVPNGVVVFPSDFLYPVSIVTEAGQSVKIVSEDEIGIRLSSTLRPPTQSRPIAVFGGQGNVLGFDVSTFNRMQLFPEAGHKGTLYYLKRPAMPVLAGTTAGRVFTYDANASTQLEWNDTAVDRLIERAIAILGENMQEDRIGGDNYQKANQ